MNQRFFSILLFILLAAALLIQCGTAPTDERNTSLTGAGNDRTPDAILFDGATSGSTNAMDVAFAHGANINARNSFSWTPLMIAVFYDKENCVHWLIQHGANLNACSDTRVTALLEAARVADPAILNDLIAAGANVHAVDQAGRNALIFACETPRGALVIHHLLSYGLDPNSREADGQSPLMEAAAGADVPLARILLQAGADLHAVDQLGRTALDFAQMSHDEAIIAFLAQERPSGLLLEWQTSPGTIGN